MPNIFRWNRIWWLHHHGFWLITLFSFILLISFDHIYIYIISISISISISIYLSIYMWYIYIYIYICPQRLRNECPWNSQNFVTCKIAHTQWGSNPRSLEYIPSSINSRHVSDHQNNASQIYFYLSGAPNQEIVFGNDKNMNCWCPMKAILNFTICGKRVPFTAWHTEEMDSIQKFHIETTNDAQKCLQVFIQGYISIFWPDYVDNDHLRDCAKS